jgi:hypothetical protein
LKDVYRDNTYIVVSKEMSGKIRQLFRFYRRVCIKNMKMKIDYYKKVDRKNKEIHDLLIILRNTSTGMDVGV